MKIKEWWNENKKLVITGTLAAGATAACFMLKNKTGVDAGIRLSLNFNGRDDYMEYRKNNQFTNVNINDPGLSVSELGKLGDVIKSRLVDATDDLKIDHLNFSYNAKLKED